MIGQELHCMPLRTALLRCIGLALALAGATATAGAQGLSEHRISGEDILRALIWTGHYSMLTLDDPGVAYEHAFHSWQKARHYSETKHFPEEQAQELLLEAETRRNSFGWTKLEDKSVGFSIGVPARLVQFEGVRYDNGSLSYDFRGSVAYRVLVRYGDMSCGNLQIGRIMSRIRPTFRVRYGNGYALAQESATETTYLRTVCRTTGVVIASSSIARSDLEKNGVLISAMAESIDVARNFNPTAMPRPKIENPAPSSGDLIAASATRATSPKAASEIDDSGRTTALKRQTRDGSDLSVEQVFDKVAPAVFVVQAGDRMGSAVAVDEHELLTNCHVVKETPRVSLTHDKTKFYADVVSMNEKADRCVLRTTQKLDHWVSIRPFEDIKIGERALTVGTPQGLDLTVADGIVSSKRTHEERRLVQTTAPISQGSSGGGLFDAQGHLLGITTFMLLGGQNLNFAIAAEDYVKEPAKEPAKDPAKPNRK
jgi:hypothetical protein